MKGVGHFLFRCFAKALSWLPWSFVYLFAGFLAFVLQYIFSYRKKVIEDNLAKSFPEKSTDELRLIRKQYYSHLSRLILETIRMQYISKEELIKRVPVHGAEWLEKYSRENKNVILLTGHFGNWEWAAMRLGLSCSRQFKLAYKPLSDPFFEDYYKRMRSRFGNKPLTMLMMPRDLLSQKEPSVTGVMADQTPSNADDLWLMFLNRETLLFGGVEKLAVKTKSAVVFGKMIAVKRGRYIIDIEPLTDDASTLPKGDLMKIYVREMEKYIHQYPFNWLWSHRRWKHQRK